MIQERIVHLINLFSKLMDIKVALYDDNQVDYYNSQRFPAQLTHRNYTTYKHRTILHATIETILHTNIETILHTNIETIQINKPYFTCSDL